MWGDSAPDCESNGDEAALSSVKAGRELDWQPTHSWREAETEQVERPEGRR